ncbi:MAG: Wzz/FepE/Etk N-terminal domain-containing protein [Runella zeae]
MANKEQVYWEDQEEEFDFKAFFWKYLRYWYWFVISALIALVGAYFYVRQQVPIYKISAVLLIKDESKGGMATSEALKDLELYSSNKIIENEIELLKSRAMLERVVNDLKLTTSYYQKGKVRSEEEIFGTCPLWVQAGTLTPLAYAEPMWIKVLNKNEFQLQDEDGTIKGKFGYSQNVKSD